MEEKFYEKDWFTVGIAVVVILFAVVSNYYYHGGHLQW